MRLLPVVVLGSAALLACVPAAPAGAIVGGAVDGSAHPYVGALLTARGQPFCSGVLVANQNSDDHLGGRVFLTSAHCMGKAGNQKRVRVTFAPTTSGGPTFVGTYHVMPGYVPSTYANDIAIVVLDDAPAIRAVHLDDGDTALRPGATVTTVGYGTPSNGTRKWATEVVTGSSSRWLFLKAGSGNSCNMDSGGPDLAKPDPDDSTAPVVVALTDQGSCSWDEDYPVSGPAVYGFVNDPDFVNDAD